MEARPDVVLLLVGTNDVTHMTNLRALEEDLGRLLSVLAGWEVPVAMSSLPEFRATRAIPWLLRLFFDRRGRAVHRLHERAAAGGSEVGLVDVRRMVGQEFVADVSKMSADLFHPSAVGYGRIADALSPAAVSAAAP